MFDVIRAIVEWPEWIDTAWFIAYFLGGVYVIGFAVLLIKWTIIGADLLYQRARSRWRSSHLM